jgi:hypothetical protein
LQSESAISAFIRIAGKLRVTIPYYTMNGLTEKEAAKLHEEGVI